MAMSWCSYASCFGQILFWTNSLHIYQTINQPQAKPLGLSSGVCLSPKLSCLLVSWIKVVLVYSTCLGAITTLKKQKIGLVQLLDSSHSQCSFVFICIMYCVHFLGPCGGGWMGGGGEAVQGWACETELVGLPAQHVVFIHTQAWKKWYF